MPSNSLRASPEDIPTDSAAQFTTVHHGGYFTNIPNGNMVVIQQSNTIRKGLKLLHAKIAEDAFHDSAERGDPPRCHPHTRTAVLREIKEWITDAGARKKLIMWLYGPAGSGKTAIAQSIAEICAREGFLAASFFFGRLASGRNTLTPIIPTLAYQLSRNIPEIEDSVLVAIEKDPAIFSRSLLTQMRTLVIKPLTAIPFPARPLVVIIDGVDECGPNNYAHKELLIVLGNAALELRSLPIIFLVGSRPDYEIRTQFNQNLLIPITRTLALDNNYAPDKDIRLYLEDEFHRIHQNSLFRRTPWPATSDIDLLVKRASGQFIFASTIIKYVDSPRKDPRERLKVVLKLSPAGTEKPFVVLDLLYRTILSAVDDIEKVLKVLTWKILPERGLRHDFDSDQGFLDELLGFDVYTALLDMHALVFVSPSWHKDVQIRLYHASFSDFLLDRSRSLEYHIDVFKGYEFLCHRRLKVAIYSPRIFQHLFVRQQLSLFAENCKKILPRRNGGQISAELASLNLKEFLERMFRFGRLYEPQWGNFFKGIQRQGGDALFIFMQIKFDSFILDRLSQYPSAIQISIPKIYCSKHDSLSIRMLFGAILDSASQSMEGLSELDMLDNRLLLLMKGSKPLLSTKFDEYFKTLFTSRARAGQYWVGEGNSTVRPTRVAVLSVSEGEVMNYNTDVDKGEQLLNRNLTEEPARSHSSSKIQRDLTLNSAHTGSIHGRPPTTTMDLSTSTSCPQAGRQQDPRNNDSQPSHGECSPSIDGTSDSLVPLTAVGGEPRVNLDKDSAQQPGADFPRRYDSTKAFVYFMIIASLFSGYMLAS